MGHPFDAAWSVIVEKAEYVNPASPLLGEALDRVRRARPPYLPNQAARSRAENNPRGYNREDLQWIKEQGLDPNLGMKHNIRTALRLDRTPKAGQPMDIGGQMAPAGSRDSARLSEMKGPPSPRYSPEGATATHPMLRPFTPSGRRRLSSDKGPSAEDMLFDMAAPDVYNPQNFPISPMEGASMQEGFANMLGKDPMRNHPFRPGDVNDPRYG